MKQDKCRGIVLLNKCKYTERFLVLLNTNQFIKLYDDPTKVYEAKVQRTLRKMQHKFTHQEYQKNYPTDLHTGRFYGTGKANEVFKNRTINDLSIRPIVSNTGMASYHLAKYLAHPLSPLSQNEFTVKSTKRFTSKVKQMELHES